jgi:hypothetical protein
VSNGQGDKGGGIPMDSLITAAARALVQGDLLGATLVFDILVAIFLSRTIATPPAVAPSTETPPVISHATTTETYWAHQAILHSRLGTSSL